MSYGNPQQCKNNCGAWIYFDKDSKVGHPTVDKWLPLEYNHDTGIKTGLIHQCPADKKSNSTSKQKSSSSSLSLSQTTQQQPNLEKVTEESIQKGITAQKKFDDMCIEVEGIGLDVNQTRIRLEALDSKIDRLLNLFTRAYSQTQQQQQR